MKNNLTQKANELGDKLIAYMKKCTNTATYQGIEETFKKLGMEYSANTFRSARVWATPYLKNGTELADLLKASNEVVAELKSERENSEYEITAVKLNNKAENMAAVFIVAPEAVKTMMEKMPRFTEGRTPHIYRPSICDRIINYFAEKRATKLATN